MGSIKCPETAKNKFFPKLQGQNKVTKGIKNLQSIYRPDHSAFAAACQPSYEEISPLRLLKISPCLVKILQDLNLGAESPFPAG